MDAACRIEKRIRRAAARDAARGAGSSVMLAIGLMSGTSADGIDAALVDLAPAAPGAQAWPALRIGLRSFLTLPYPDPVRAELFRLFADGAGGTSRLSRLHFV